MLPTTGGVETVESPSTKVFTPQNVTLFLTIYGKESAPRADIPSAIQLPDSLEGCDTFEGGGVMKGDIEI